MNKKQKKEYEDKITLVEAASKTGISINTLKAAASSGRLKVKKSGGTRLVTILDVVSMVEKSTKKEHLKSKMTIII